MEAGGGEAGVGGQELVVNGAGGTGPCALSRLATCNLPGLRLRMGYLLPRYGYRLQYPDILDAQG